MRLVLMGFIVLSSITVWAQFKPKPKIYTLHSDGLQSLKNESVKDPIFLGYYLKGQGNICYAAPWQTYWPSSRAGSSASFWLGSTSIQSFGKGKMSTVYFFDMLGNLTNSRNLIDVKSKGKRRFQLNLSPR